MTDFAATRAQFDLPENLVYLDGNSLGPLPCAARERLAREVDDHWGGLLIRGWNEAGWIDLPDRVGDRIARLIGAPAGSVTAGDSTSVNLYKALTGALSLAGDRKVVLSDRLDRHDASCTWPAAPRRGSSGSWASPPSWTVAALAYTWA